MLVHEAMRRLHPPNPAIHRLRSGHDAMREIVEDALRARPEVHTGGLEQRFHLRRERESVAGQFAEEQGFLSHPVTHEQQTCAADVPDGDGEHPAQVVDEIVAVFFIQVWNHLGIGFAAKGVTRRQQGCAQLRRVVDLAIDHGDDRAVFVFHRLSARRGEVDDRQAREAEDGSFGGDRAPIVGATVGDPVKHPDHYVVRDLRTDPYQAGDPAHQAAAPLVGETARPLSKDCMNVGQI